MVGERLCVVRVRRTIVPGMPLRLTERSACAGCASKLGVRRTAQRSCARVPTATHDRRVLVGIATGDDAGVVRLRDDLAIVQTVDFFTPIVDDPYEYGRIAATNAISRHLRDGRHAADARSTSRIPRGAGARCRRPRSSRRGRRSRRKRASVILGGHTVTDDEPKYGMAVTGTIRPDRIVPTAEPVPVICCFSRNPSGPASSPPRASAS